MERQKKILDASVLVKIFSEEENSERATKLVDQHTKKEIKIIISELTFLEVLNALKYKKNSVEKIQKSNEDLWNFQFKIHRLNRDIINSAINLALENNFTIYDSIYIALAQFYNCDLITADEKLAGLQNVMLLKNMNNTADKV